MSNNTSAGEARQSPTRAERVIWGKPYIDAVISECDQLSAQRVFLVVSGTLNRDTDLITRLEKALGKRLAGKHVGIRPHTPWEEILDLASELRDTKADLLVSLGGGSITDASKIVLLALANNTKTLDQLGELVFGKGSIDTMEAPSLPLICIPTSLSGGEYNSGSGGTDSRIGAKRLFRHPLCIPKLVILDPVITLHTPDWLWLSTGLRALDHCVETIASLVSNPESDELAASGLKKLVESLLITKSDRLNIAARLQSQLGVLEATRASVMKEVDLGASHAIGHVLGGACNVPHGYTSCIMLPAVMRYNLKKNQERQKIVRSVLLAMPQVTKVLEEQQVSQDGSAGEILAAIISQLGLPRSLEEVGVSENRFEEIAQKTLDDPWAITNPIPLKDTSQVVEILRLAA
ncbi:maleylacetate reductase [Basidiobolus meristosporus CBS 931.73]|uniref:Maleylacetate reductase n=1 Tax=Basidiobolus meristosporus CBS 931.73 TaxID=1314790 RepID=A0A1Y1Y656_9FUNG|nr:maleylacetate reductase [Basidiobolus meristosporus CBS 931.73]|eukprot:ORX93473.1 maleylacetate reductase [Basidiobolus meristosporus CBS 931.73]